MKAVYKKVGEAPQVVDIENTLEALQKAVGGYIEVIGVEGDILMICDEEGKLKGKAANFTVRNDVIVGDVLFVQNGYDGDFTDINEANVKSIMTSFDIFE